VIEGQTRPRARLIAFYLPQFHPIPENDEWWGKGYTDWVAVARGVPLFNGHYQPHIPADLGFYDLRLPEVREAQAELAASAGIEGFAYWHYWFAGKRLLERPFEAVLRSGNPRLPFCLAWANHTWRSVWSFGIRNKPLIDQTYPGLADHRAHFDELLKAFTDERYITVEGKPLVYIYDPYAIPDVKRMTDSWREWALQAGLKGLHLVGLGLPTSRLDEFGFDATNHDFVHRVKEEIPRSGLLGDLQHRFRYRNFVRKPVIYTYREVLPYLLKSGPMGINDYPTIVPNWDNTPRSLFSGLVYHQSTPELFRIHLRQALAKVLDRPLERRIVFVKSWNEWGEGNHLEPDQRFGHAYLNVIRSEICERRDGAARP
jgi:lipopolysaccharide biosynthesis protein